MTGKQIAAIIAVALFVPMIIGGIYWGVSVATSDVRGQGNAVQIQNDAQNRMQSAKEFTELYGKVQLRDKQIDTETEALAEAQGQEQDLDFYRENLRGAVRSCESAVEQYNALSGNPQKAPWRPSHLPERIDQSDPAFDCKRSADVATPMPTDPNQPETGAGEPSPEPAPATSN